MQQLLAGQKRFPEFRSRPWPLHRFDALCEELSDRNGKQLGADSVMGVIKGVGFDANARSSPRQGDLARYKIVPPGGFAYNPMRLNIGSIAFNDLPGVTILVSPDYVVFRARSDARNPGLRQSASLLIVLDRFHEASGCRQCKGTHLLQRPGAPSRSNSGT